MTRNLLIVSALAELAAGLALIAAPSMSVSMLLGASLDTVGGLAAARVAGAALLSLALACWLARHDGQSRAGRAVIAAMLVYDLAVIAVLAHARTGLDVSGALFWPAVGLHTAMAVWCSASLRSVSPSSAAPARG